MNASCPCSLPLISFTYNVPEIQNVSETDNFPNRILSGSYIISKLTQKIVPISLLVKDHYKKTYFCLQKFPMNLRKEEKIYFLVFLQVICAVWKHNYEWHWDIPTILKIYQITLNRNIAGRQEERLQSWFPVFCFQTSFPVWRMRRISKYNSQRGQFNKQNKCKNGTGLDQQKSRNLYPALNLKY